MRMSPYRALGEMPKGPVKISKIKRILPTLISTTLCPVAIGIVYDHIHQPGLQTGVITTIVIAGFACMVYMLSIILIP